MMPEHEKPFERAVPYKRLSDIEGYISIQDGKDNWVMKISLNVLKVVKVEGQKDPTGKPVFNFMSNNAAVLLTNDEYKAMTGRGVEP